MSTLNHMRTFVLIAALTGLFVLAGHAMGGKNGAMLALVMAVVMNFGAYWFSDRMVLSAYNAVEVGEREAPELYNIVAELARRGNMPMPRVYIIQDDSPNAFATGRNPENAAVAATTGILRILNRQELTGVMAHELAHVKHRDILTGTIAATIAGAVTSLAQFGALFGSSRDEEEGGGGGGLVGILMMILAPIAAMLIQMAISRGREYEADAEGARLAGNPLWLSSALRKLEMGSQQIPFYNAEAHPASSHLFIVNPLSGATLASLFSTHPPMHERIQRLETMRS
ncbi:MAG: zinc metalloprotease HtpX [Magnetococcales bacterium]|nr:zinc metalloprotease HtpX [Magnetococcales bacterium]NGZ28200.1 zinc metalloprotease HtpX [Magnetococcales bacterium]